MNNEFAAKNNRIAATVRSGAEFTIIHKDHTHFENEPDGYWVSEATPDSKVGYYDMVLVDLTVDELRTMGCTASGCHVLVEQSTNPYDLMVSCWIPLPVLFEQLGVFYNFKDYNDLSMSRAIDMVKSKVLIPSRSYTNRKAVMTKKCGHLVAA